MNMPYFDHGNLWAVLPGASLSNPRGLNTSETELARMIVSGLGIAEIADILGLTGRSVLSIRERLMQKLGAHSLAHLENILSSAGMSEDELSEAIYLDDFTDEKADLDDEPDLIFLD
jgi:DNA-binding CsgD family transcriptional regulator